MDARLSDLRWREVINITDGRRLGYVSDAIIDFSSGKVTALIVPGPPRFFGLFGRGEDTVLPYGSITRVGPDIILVSGAGDFPHERGRGSRGFSDF